MTVPLLLSLLYFPLMAFAATVIPIPLKFDNDNHYLLGLNMSTGPSQRSFGLALTTSTGGIVVEGTNCSSCKGGPAYNVSASTTANPLPSKGIKGVQVVGGYVNGSLVSEDCGVLVSNGSAWFYQNQTIVVANQTNLTFPSQTSGIFGLGTDGILGSINDTVYGKWSSQNPSITNFTFGMSLSPPGQNMTEAGVLHWSALNQPSFTGDITWVNTTSSNETDVPSAWVVQMDGWTFNSGASMYSGGPCITLLDPFYPKIFLPQNVSHEIFSGIPGAVSQISSDIEVWQLPCSTTIDFSVVFGGSTFMTNPSNLVTNINGSCFSTIVGWTDPTNNVCILGSNFISSIYLVFTILFAELAQLTQMSLGFAQRSPSSVSGLSVLAAGGIAAGVVVAFIFIILLSYFIYRKRRASRVAAIQRRPSSTAGLLPTSADSHKTTFVNDHDASTTTHHTFITRPTNDLIPLISPTTADRPVTVSIQRTTENLGNSQNVAASQSLLSHTPPDEIESPAPVQQDFTIDPYVVPPPVRLTGMDDVKRAFEERRRGDPEEEGDSMANEPPSDNRSESSVTVVSGGPQPKP